MSRIYTHYFSHDVNITIQNPVVTAESLGLGTIDKELNLPKNIILAIGLCFKYPDDNRRIKQKIPMNGIFFGDKYDAVKAKTAVDENDNIFKNIYLKEKLMLVIVIDLRVLPILIV